MQELRNRFHAGAAKLPRPFGAILPPLVSRCIRCVRFIGPTFPVVTVQSRSHESAFWLSDTFRMLPVFTMLPSTVTIFLSGFMADQSSRSISAFLRPANRPSVT
jgi:hypothetical protein